MVNEINQMEHQIITTLWRPQWNNCNCACVLNHLLYQYPPSFFSTPPPPIPSPKSSFSFSICLYWACSGSFTAYSSCLLVFLLLRCNVFFIILENLFVYQIWGDISVLHCCILIQFNVGELLLYWHHPIRYVPNRCCYFLMCNSLFLLYNIPLLDMFCPVWCTQ